MTLLDTLNRIADKLDEIADKLDGQTAAPQSSQTFDEFARYYFDTFRKRKVTPYTLEKDIVRYNAHICPIIGRKPLIDITPDQVQKLADSLENRPKTAHEVYTLVNVICKMAIKHHIITENPCDVVLLPDYERQHGKALTRDDERRLLTATADTEYQQTFAVALYAGLRPNEYATATIDGNFVIARNSKQKDGKEHTKRIPVSPMLAPYVATVTKLPSIPLKRLRNVMRKHLPTHKLYDLRTTFYTRCQECGVTDLARKLFVGHSLGTLADTYTDVSDDYLLAEAQKLKY